MKSLPPLKAAHFIDGYVAEARNRKTTELAPPSVNLWIDSGGSAYTRPGTEQVAWDLNTAGYGAEPHYLKEYNVTVFVVGTKVLYVEHDFSDAVIDTGVTVTAGTTSTISDYLGNVYVTNPTDGVKRIAFTRLDTAVLASDTEIFVEDGSTYRFVTPAANLRIAGTNEAYTGRDDSTWKFTGTNASQGYAAGRIAIGVVTPTAPKFKKAVFWKESMNGFGPQTHTSSQAAKHTLFFGDFASAGDWADVEDFSGGLSGNELVGKKGVLTNIIATNDYLYLFTQDEGYSIGVADVDTTTGARPPDYFGPHGSINENTACEMDGNVITVTNEKRIIRSQLRANGTVATTVPDEAFDGPMTNLLNAMDEDQTGSHVFYWKGGKKLFCQLNIDGEVLTLCYDNNMIRAEGRSSPGRWLPPIRGWLFKKYFEIGSDLYATDATDDTIFKVASSESDDGGSIESVFATGIYEIEEGRTTANWGIFELSLGMTQNTTITFEPLISEEEGTPHTITDSGVDFGTSAELGTVTVGEEVIGGSGVGATFGDKDVSLGIYPRKGKSFQAILRAEGDGQAMRIDSWNLPKIKFYSKSLTTLT